jgi:ABC-type sugar transport system ATPase subunit
MTEVYVSEPLGEILIIDLTLGKKRIKVATSPDFDINIGEKLWVTFTFDKTHIFDAETGKVVA